MELFVAIVADRHIDPIIRVFSDPGRAIGWAKATFRDLVARPSEIEEENIDGCLWSARYGEEGDYAHVERRVLDEAD